MSESISSFQNSPLYSPSSIESNHSQQVKSVNPSSDTLSTAIDREVLKKVDRPQLIAPKEVVLEDYYTIVGMSSSELRNQIDESHYQDYLIKRQKRMAFIANQSIYTTDYETRKNSAIKEINVEVAKLTEDLTAIFEDIKAIEEAQNNLIQQLNAGKAEEIRQSRQLTLAYQDYVVKLQTAGITRLPNDVYSVPPDKVSVYDELTMNYQKSVDTFNAYWEIRAADYAAYNETLSAYNEKMGQLNTALAFYSINFNLTFPTIKRLDPIDTTSFNEPIAVPALLPTDKKSATNMSIPIPPSFIFANLQRSPTAMVSAFTHSEMQVYRDAMFNDYYLNIIPLLDQKDVVLGSMWNFTYPRVFKSNQSKLKHENLINDKPLLLEIIALLKQKQFETEQALPSDKIVEERVQSVLGRDIYKAVLQNELSLTPEQANAIANQLVFLSLNILNETSTEVAIVNFEKIAMKFPHLPKNSPLYGILFSLLLAKQVQQNISLNLNEYAIKELITLIPELKNLTAPTIESIHSAMNIGQLYLAEKSVELHVGIPQSIDNNEMKIEPEMLTRLNELGFSTLEANILLKTQNEIISNGILGPSATLVARESINLPLLTDSLKASIVLFSDQKIPLEQIEVIVDQAIRQTFSNLVQSTTPQFRLALEENLKNLGILQNISSIVQAAIIAPSTNQLKTDGLPFYLKTLINSNESSALANEITEDVLQQISKYGIDREITVLEKKLINSDFAILVQNTFKDSVQDLEQLPAFFKKLMNPAYALLYTANTGIMYSSASQKTHLSV